MLIFNNNKMEDLKKITMSEWEKYVTDSYNRYIEMYNMIYYNQFTNEEVRRLQRTIRFMKDDMMMEKITSSRIKDENVILLNRVNKLKDDNIMLKSKKRKTYVSDTYTNKFIDNIKSKKPRKVKYLSKKDHETKLIDIFKNIKSIKDIILLKNNDNIYDLMRNDKYYKLLKLIPVLEKISRILREKNNVYFTIQGHVCCTANGRDAIDRGTGRRNLSLARARYIYEYLMKSGVARKRMKYVGLKHKYPLGGDPKFDRRVEIEITYIKE